MYVSGVESRVQAFTKDAAADEKALRILRQQVLKVYNTGDKTGDKTFVVTIFPPESRKLQLLWFKRDFPKPLND